MQRKRSQDEILSTAQEIHAGAGLKRQRLQETCLAQPAQEREAALLREGNRRGQMRAERYPHRLGCYAASRCDRQEVQTKAGRRQLELNIKPRSNETSGWNQSRNSSW